MKVCLLTSSFPRYKGDSAGIFLHHLAKHLTLKGIDVSVLAPHDAGYKTLEVFEKLTIRRFRYFIPTRLQHLCYRSGILNNIKSDTLALFQVPLLIISELFSIVHMVQKHQIDVVHAHWTFPQGLVAVINKRLLTTPCVVTLHGSDVHGLKHPLFRFLNCMVARQADVCTANSSATRNAVPDLDIQKNISIIPMGVDPCLFKKNDAGTIKVRESVDARGKLILYAGRLIRVKGVDQLIRAMLAVIQKHPEAKLVIVGNGLERDNLLALSKKLQLGNNVIFKQEMSQNRLVEWYSASDLFVLPSLLNPSGEKEGQGVVVLEAMACGLPVVGSNAGGIPSIIKHEKTGLLAEPGDPYDLSEKMCILLENTYLREQIIENAHQMVLQRFTWESIADEFIKIYKQATQS